MNAKGIIVGAVLAGLGCTTAWAADQQFGDWTVGQNTAKTTTYAATVNDSGSVLGESCFFKTGKCFWTILLDIGCAGSDAYPALGNTSSGAVQLQIKCDGQIGSGSYRYIVVDWQDLESLLKDSNQVGFAVPMKSELFKVIRFSLNGRTDAVKLAEGVAASQYATNENQNKSEVRRATSDTTL